MRGNYSMKEVAIVGMACLFPSAPDIRTFWQNITNKVNSISDPPDDWEGNPWYEPGSDAIDRVYVKRAGYLKELSRFNPMKYGILPKAVDGAEPEHWLSLKVADEALTDAGVPDIPLNRERTEVIIGRGTFMNRGYTTMCHHSFGIEEALRMVRESVSGLVEERLAQLKETWVKSIPPFSSDTAPGLVSSIMTGRIANRLNLRGTSYSVDAACSSSLLAVEQAYYSLIAGKSDAVLAGGINLATHHPMQMLFCRLGAASRSEHISPFDESADGTLVGEGVGMMVLKRREDAERDGNRIYAIIKGVGTSSDGKGTSVVAPLADGEELAIRRAFEAANCTPESVELIEAHGTGIPLGDATEITSLTRVFGNRKTELPHVAIGSVKSNIGHLLPAAGMAGLIKTVLALYHKTLPPSLSCNRPDPRLKLDESVFYVNTETRPWIQGAVKSPRRAGVNAFGFGGSNAHVILEEYTGRSEAESEDFNCHWETELCVVTADSREDLIDKIRAFVAYLDAVPQVALKDVAYSLNSSIKTGKCRLAVVAASLEDLRKKLHHASERLLDPARERIKDKSGIYYFDAPLSREGKLAFLFPGEGSQHSNMLSDLCIHFPEVRAAFDQLGPAFADYTDTAFYRNAVFPPPTLNEEERRIADETLWNMHWAVTLVMTANQALLNMFRLLKIKPDAVAGHSSGELFALSAAGVSELSKDDKERIKGYLLIGYDTMEAIENEQAIPDAPLITVGGVNFDIVKEIIDGSTGELLIALDNCPNQIVLCCSNKDAVNTYVDQLKSKGAICQVLPFSRPYHTSLFEPARKHLENLFDEGTFTPAQVKMYSCMTTQPIPTDSAEIRRLGIDQWLNPVRFRETIEAMYNDGVRLFVEVGPKSQLTGFTQDILKKRKHLAIASNVHYRSGITQLHHALGLLAAHGVSMDLDYLYKRRNPRTLTFTTDEAVQTQKEAAKLDPVLPLGLPMTSAKDVTVEWLRGLDEEPAQAKPLRDTPASPAPATTVNTAPAAFAPVAQQTPTMPRQPQPPTQQRSSDLNSSVLAEYTRTMEAFLIDQKTVLETYLKKGPNPKK